MNKNDQEFIIQKIRTQQYPVYNYIIRTERKKIAPEIIRLTDELMKQEAKMNVKGESKTKLWTFK